MQNRLIAGHGGDVSNITSNGMHSIRLEAHSAACLLGTKVPELAMCSGFESGSSILVAKAYLCAMTKLLEQALEAVRRLPPETQDEIAHAMLNLAGSDGEPEVTDPAHLTDVLESLAQARRRQFATDAQVEAAFRRFDR
jgi:hypothetical protein